MNPILNSFLKRSGIPRVTPGNAKDDLKLYQAMRDFKILSRRTAKDVIFILLGVASAAFGLESFLLPNAFIDGGVTGISLLVAEVTTIPLPLLIALLNVPFVLLGFKVISRSFAIKTAIAVSLLSIVISTIHFPEITHDTLLVAIFGGFFLGLGIGLAIRGGAVLDGTEVMAIYLNRRFHVSLGDVIMVVNILIFAFAAWLLSVEQALYSMITYLAASKTVNFVVEGVEEYTGLTIISPKHSSLQRMLVEKMGRGVTVYKGRGGYGKQGKTEEHEILYTVVTRMEVGKIFTEVERIDPDAFILTSSVKDVKGGLVRKRAHKH
jgi:uncharacterized membrane-anchored protein YitT (DUF2179 family)